MKAEIKFYDIELTTNVVNLGRDFVTFELIGGQKSPEILNKIVRGHGSLTLIHQNLVHATTDRDLTQIKFI
jgi:hypothetical protein